MLGALNLLGKEEVRKEGQEEELHRMDPPKLLSDLNMTLSGL